MDREGGEGRCVGRGWVVCVDYNVLMRGEDFDRSVSHHGEGGEGRGWVGCVDYNVLMRGEDFDRSVSHHGEGGRGGGGVCGLWTCMYTCYIMIAYVAR